MKLTKKRIILVAAVVLVVIGIANLPKKSGPQRMQEDLETVYTVETQKAEVKPLQEYLYVNGNIQTNNTISVYPDIAGKVKSVR